VSEPHWTDFEDSWDADEYMDFDDCPYGTGGAPQLGVEDCEFTCALSESCRSIFEKQPKCVLWNIGKQDHSPECHFFHYGHCYINLSNYSPSRFKRAWWRVRCMWGKHPTGEEVLA
jgi:hypothetical protein